jgi:hypothetical protein
VRRYFGWLIRLLALLGLGVASLLFGVSSWESVTGYQTKHVFHADLPGGEPLTRRVVLVVLDGIRVDVSRQMPFLQELARSGAGGTARAGMPSLSNPARAAMATGAWAEIHGVTNNGRYEPPAADSIFSLARGAGVPRAAAGSSFWMKAFGAHLEEAVLVHSKHPHDRDQADRLVEWQRRVCGEDVDFLRNYASGLLVMGITAADSAGHDFGGESTTYRRVAQEVDICLGALIKELDDGETTFVVCSDHGHIDRRGRGGHGGSEEEVLNVPLVLAGKAIRRSSGWRAQQIDVAPTICALLGLPLPSTNQGRILWEAMAVPDGIAGALRSREREQRRLALSKLPSREQSLEGGRAGRRLGSVMAAAPFTLLLVGMFANYRSRWAWLVAAAGLYYAAYYILFWALGLGYSLSVVGREEYLAGFFGRNVVCSVVALIASSGFLYRKALGPRGVLVLDQALLISTTVALQVIVMDYWFGLRMDDFMPDLTVSFKAYLDLLQICAVGGTSPVVFASTILMERRREKRLTEETFS